MSFFGFFGDGVRSDPIYEVVSGVVYRGSRESGRPVYDVISGTVYRYGTRDVVYDVVSGYIYRGRYSRGGLFSAPSEPIAEIISGDVYLINNGKRDHSPSYEIVSGNVYKC